MICAKFLYIILMICSVIALSLKTADSADTAAHQEPTVFTNQDLEKYKKPSDYTNTSPAASTGIEEKKGKADERKEQKEKESWCKKTTQYKNKKERIQGNILDIEKALSKDNLCWKSRKSLNKNLEKEKKQLRYAEKDIRDFEEEAHRKGIPAGWLRCQFE